MYFIGKSSFDVPAGGGRFSFSYTFELGVVMPGGEKQRT
jgi:hypothetical protein